MKSEIGISLQPGINDRHTDGSVAEVSHKYALCNFGNCGFFMKKQSRTKRSLCVR